MSDSKTKFDCKLTTHGTKLANTKAIEDLKIPDPEPKDGIQAIKEAIEEEKEDGSKSDDS